MTISGQFKTYDNLHTIAVTITSPANGTNIVIGNNENSHVWFSSDPVVIDLECEDTFDVILAHRATINIVTDQWLGDYLFANNITDIPVQIMYDNVLVFDGYVEHNVYNQGYANKWEEISLNCIDHLLALENLRLSDTTDYQTLVENADIHTFKWILQQLLGSTVNIYFDGSKGAFTNASSSAIDYWLFRHISISDNTWLSDNESEIWTNKELLEEILRYLNLHIIQMPDYANNSHFAYYIFDWDYTQRRTSTAARFKKNINYDSSEQAGFSIQDINVSVDMYAGNDSNVTLSNVYNRILVSVGADTIEEVISNPLDTDSLISPFDQYNRYMTEFFCPKVKKWAIDDNAWMYFLRMLRGEQTTWDVDKNGWFRHWYMQYIENPQWELNSYQVSSNTGSSTTGWMHTNESTKIYDDTKTTQYTAQGAINGVIDQWVLPKSAFYRGYTTYTNGGTTVSRMTGDPIYTPGWPLGQVGLGFGSYYSSPHLNMAYIRRGNCVGAVMVDIFSSAKINASDSASPYTKDNKAKQLIITTNNICSPTVISNMTQNGGCLCKFLTTQAASFIPQDDRTKYYLVFSGKIVLSPFISCCYDYHRCLHNDYNYQINKQNFPDANYLYGAKGSLYTRYFYDTHTNQMDLGTEYNQTSWKEPVTSDYNPNFTNLSPFIKDDGLKRYKYYSFSGVDEVQKVGVLICSLRIGNKYLNEGTTDITIDGETYSYPNHEYEWTTNSSATFTIGFDPKLDDYVIGQEYEIGEEMSIPSFNEDVNKGIAIAISRSDMLSGQVEFKILSPMNIVWDDNHHRHRTWFRRSKDWTNVKTILYDPALEQRGEMIAPQTYYDQMTNAVENIVLTDFKCTLVTDNANNNVLQEYDIIYMSDEETKYVEEKSVDFNILSGLTETERTAFGVADNAGTNFVLGFDNAPLEGIKTYNNFYDDNGIIRKPEKLYCKQYYEEYKQPKILFDTTLKYTGENMFFNKYVFGFFPGRKFYTTRMETDLKYLTTTLSTKEI